jgi:hypothetical protein
MMIMIKVITLKGVQVDFIRILLDLLFLNRILLADLLLLNYRNDGMTIYIDGYGFFK